MAKAAKYEVPEGMIVIDGVQYKRRRAEQLGLIEAPATAVGTFTEAEVDERVKAALAKAAADGGITEAEVAERVKDALAKATGDSDSKQPGSPAATTPTLVGPPANKAREASTTRASGGKKAAGPAAAAAQPSTPASGDVVLGAEVPPGTVPAEGTAGTGDVVTTSSEAPA